MRNVIAYKTRSCVTGLDLGFAAGERERSRLGVRRVRAVRERYLALALKTIFRFFRITDDPRSV